MDRANRLGRLDCKDCLQNFQAAITRAYRIVNPEYFTAHTDYSYNETALDEPIDLYSQWIDACEEVNTPSATTLRVSNAAPRRPAAAATAGNADDDDDDADLPDLPGTQAQKKRQSAADEDEDEDEEDAGVDDDEEEDDADASLDVSAADKGYARRDNAKMAALVEQKRSRAVVEDDEDSD